jgi:hypothetical protein
MINGKFIIKGRRHQLVDESKLLMVLQKKHMEIRRRTCRFSFPKRKAAEKKKAARLHATENFQLSR